MAAQMTTVGDGVEDEVPQEAAVLLAEHTVALTYEQLPPAVVDMTKRAILDTVGVILPGGTTAPEARALVDLIVDAGGRPEASVLGFGAKVPAWSAGYANGAMANCQDFSDLHPDAAHISSPVVPAVLAVAERRGGVSGREFITAVAAGVDLQCRLTLAAGKLDGAMAPWHPAPMFGVFSAALACSKLLGAGVDCTVNALGLAFTQASGTHEIVFGKGSTVRGIGHALPGEVGVRAALLGHAGVGGVRRPFDGPHGFWNAYYGGRYDRDRFLGGLGEQYDVMDDGFKPWPSCGFTHVHVDMVRTLIAEHGLRPADIGAVTLTVGDFARGQTEPLTEWRRPANPMLAKLSVPFTVAIALLQGDVRIRDYSDGVLVDPAVLAMADRIGYRYDSSYDFVSGQGFPGGEIEIVTTDGRTLRRRQTVAYGHPNDPMSWDDLVAKFVDCAGYAVRPAPAEQVVLAAQHLRELDTVEDLGKVVDLIA